VLTTAPQAVPDTVARLEARLSELAGAPVELERPNDPAHGDYATNVAMRLAPVQRRSPREVGEELATAATELDEVDRAEVAGPGFVNLWLSPSWFGEALGEILAAGPSYGGGSAESPEKVQVEMVSANPTGPITVASARNGAIGDSVARQLEFAGHEVSREYYYNDAGAQMERFRASVEAVRRGEEPPEDGYRGDYVAELAAADEDPVPRMLGQIEASLERFRIHFDSWMLQSRLEQRLPEFLPRVDTYEKDGAVWARSSAYGDDDDRVIVRSQEQGGTPTYRAADIVYLVDKLERGFDRALYVLGADHHGTRKWYEAVARMLGYDPARVEVLLYQLVHLTRGGEQAKMSKRRGDVVFLDDFVDEVGVDAARWYLVNRGPDQTIEIDVDLAAERSEKNPVYYVQYAHARIAAIRRNAGEAQVSAEVPAELAQAERDLVKRLADFPGVAAEAAERRGPHAIPTYAIRLADDFHRFYHHQRVLESEAQAFRLGLCTATQNVIARCLDLVGVAAPERM
jgi:arginyl-tRNA synthetase